MTISSSRCFLAFDRQIDHCSTWLRGRVFGACGYDAEVLLDRLVQRLIEISLAAYASALEARGAVHNGSSNSLADSNTKLDCGRAFIELGSGRVTVSLRQWLRNQCDFLLHWGFCLLSAIFAKSVGQTDQPAVIALGVGDDAIFFEDSDRRFVTYCRSGPIEPLQGERRLLVESLSTNISSDPSRFVYCKRPLTRRVREVSLGISGRVRLLIDHVVLLFTYTFVTIRAPELSLIGKDFAYTRISSELDKRGLLHSILLTCSSFNWQPLWTRALTRTEVHMIWYAQNWKPVSYITDEVQADHPNLRWIRADTHWVWTRAFAEYLRRLGLKASFEVVGPITWHLPVTSMSETGAIRIVVFDVPPFSNAIALRNGETSNYFQPSNLLSFIEDVMSLRPAIEEALCEPVTFHLKMKRGFASDYDRGYFEHVEALGARGTVSLEHHSTNIYSLVSGSELVIAYPFTSTGYIAEYLKVPAIYYDPTKLVARHDFCDSKDAVHFARGRQELLELSVALLRSSRLESKPLVRQSTSR